MTHDPSRGARIAFIGLGAMGAPQAANLIKAGFPVTVHNRTRSKEEPLAALGAARAASPAEAARDADIVITMVSDVPGVKEVVCGASGVLAGIRKGKLVIDMSTIGPGAAREIAESCGQAGVHFVDAPVTGGVGGARDGALSILVGAAQADFAEAMPALEAMGSTITHCGGVGSGQAVKLINQVIGVANFCGVAEGLVLAERMGLDREQTIQALAPGAAGSWMLSNLGPKMVSRDFASGFKIDLQIKDLRLVLQEAEVLGVPAVVTRLAMQFLKAAASAGHGEDGTQAVITAFERLLES